MLAIIASMSAHPRVTNRTNANLLCRQHNEHLVADLVASTTSKLSRRHDEYLHDDHLRVASTTSKLSRCQHNEHLVADLVASTTSKLSCRHDEYLHDNHLHVVSTTSKLSRCHDEYLLAASSTSNHLVASTTSELFCHQQKHFSTTPNKSVAGHNNNDGGLGGATVAAITPRTRTTEDVAEWPTVPPRCILLLVHSKTTTAPSWPISTGFPSSFPSSLPKPRNSQ